MEQRSPKLDRQNGLKIYLIKFYTMLTCYPPRGDTRKMTKTKQPHSHQSHKEVLLRLKREKGHLAKVIQMIEEEEACLKISQQLYAVEKALTQAKKNIIHDHIEHCLEATDNHKKQNANFKEFKEITKHL